MKIKRTELSRLYHAAWQKYLKGDPAASMKPAHALGRRALAWGWRRWIWRGFTRLRWQRWCRQAPPLRAACG